MDFIELDQILPRFVRITDFRKRNLEEEEELGLFGKPVVALPEFIALPGYQSLSKLQVEKSKDYRSLGLFPMDIASALPIYAMNISNQQPTKVLDLCCCPGSKFQMISEYVHPSSTVIGVDISEKRMKVCSSLLERYLAYHSNNQTETPRSLLFLADGIRFGNEGYFGSLEYDSEIIKNESSSRKNNRKRKNKSCKMRIKKQLLQNYESLTKYALDKNTSDTELPSLTESQNITPNSFDYVLVDSECTHDASYRHMKYIQRGFKWQSKGDDSNSSDENENLIPLSLTFNIRDLKTSSEGKYHLQSTQRSLISNGFKLLMPGGVLVYSTCSDLDEQNEDIVNWLLENEPSAQLEVIDLPFCSITDSNVTILSDSAVDSKEKADFLCHHFNQNQKLMVYSGKIPGTIRVNYNLGMSGHFIARIRKLW